MTSFLQFHLFLQNFLFDSKVIYVFSIIVYIQISIIALLNRVVLLFSQNSLFASIDDHQYRQLYHPSEDYNSFRDNSPSPNNRPSISVKRSSSSNLDPIREEGTSNSDQRRAVSRGNIQTRQGTEAIASAARPSAEDERETPPSQRGKFYI